MEALIWGTFAAQPGLAAFEDARIAAQAAWRQQRGGQAPLGQDVPEEDWAGRRRQQRHEWEGIVQHSNGMRKAEAIGVQVDLRRRGGHQAANGIVRQLHPRPLLQHPRGVLERKGRAARRCWVRVSAMVSSTSQRSC